MYLIFNLLFKSFSDLIIFLIRKQLKYNKLAIYYYLAIIPINI